MINFRFGLSNPLSARWDTLFYASTLLTKHKVLELQIVEDNTFFNFEFGLSFKKDHAGLISNVGLFGLHLFLSIVDTRHWDTLNDRWCDYE